MRDAELQEMINLSLWKVFEQKAAIEAGGRIKDLYGEFGYFNTHIEVSFTNAGANQVNIIYSIKEGPPCLIQTLNLESENEQLIQQLEGQLKKYKNRNIFARD